MKDYSFHSKLMTIGEELDILHVSDGNNLGLTKNKDRVKILAEYLSERGITEYEIESASDIYSTPTNDQVEEFVRKNIDSGYPVLLSAGNDSGNGHAAICYKYVKDVYYCNMGWTSSKSYSYYNMKRKYSIFTDAMVLKLNMSHKHSNNYEVNHNGHIDKYCYCNSNIMTYTSVVTKFDSLPCVKGAFVISSWVTDIDEKAFYKNQAVRAIGYEENAQLSEIKDNAFYGCKNLMIVHLPKSIQSIGTSAFCACANLQSVFFEEGSRLATIGMNAFMSDSKLKYIRIPDSVTNIESSVFMGATELKSVTFSNNVAEIGTAAFSGGDGVDLGHITVYTEAVSKKNNWDKEWNGTINYAEVMKDNPDINKFYEKRPVFWNCILSSDKSYVVSFYKMSNTIENSGAANGVSAPERYGYTFGGWYSNAMFIGTPYSATNIATAPNGKYYAKWI